MKLDWKVMLATVIAGIVAFFLNEFLYNILVDTLSRPVLVAILVTVAVLLCCIVISVVVLIMDTTQNRFLFLRSRGLIFVGLVGTLAILFPLTMAFEWIYDHEVIQAQSASSYVFVLDESGSMRTNDPNLTRYNAVENVVNQLTADTPYAVYMFSNECVRIRDMAPVSAGHVERPADADNTMMGGTKMLEALKTVLRDFQSGILQSGNEAHVILLTDGASSDMKKSASKAILEDYKRSGIVISTVGLGSVDESLMLNIAQTTNGHYVQVSDAQQLVQGFTNAAVWSSDRDLLSPRNLVEKNGLYLFLRILLLTLIGVMAAFARAMACATDNDTATILILGAGAALAGALIMEIGLALSLPTFLCRLLYWLCIAVTPKMAVRRIRWLTENEKVYTTNELLHSRNANKNSGKSSGKKAGKKAGKKSGKNVGGSVEW